MLALKGFAMFSVFPLIRKTLFGVCASSPNEARLGREEFGREVHTFAAAYSDKDIRQILAVSDHVVFNSFAQWERFRPMIRASDRLVLRHPGEPGPFWKWRFPFTIPAPLFPIRCCANTWKGNPLKGFPGSIFIPCAKKTAMP
ncbi:MAG: hypothetical protein R2860_12435 [Desulfobacterales bacterium]